MDLHTSSTGVPNLDGTELGGILDDLTNGHNIRPGIRLMAAGIRSLAEDATTGALNTGDTQLLLAQLCGAVDDLDMIGALAALTEHLTSSANQALHGLPDDVRKNVQVQGETARFKLTDPDLRQPASNACAALDTPPTWRCPDCDTYNTHTDHACHTCGTTPARKD
jgi:hypothetical protein